MIKKILELSVSKIKKEEYKLSDELHSSYLLGEVLNRTIWTFKGIIKRVGLKKCGKLIFVGKNVKIKAKRNIMIGDGVTIEDHVILDGLSKEGLSLGNNVRVGSFTQMKCTGSLKNMGKGLKIGDNTGIGEYCFFGAAGGIEIGDNVIMGQNVRFHSENHNYSDLDVPIKHQGVTNQGIKVGSDCWIGAGAVFLDGVTVGDGCVIGANTLINKDIPSFSIAVGNPVKVIKNRKEMNKL